MFGGEKRRKRLQQIRDALQQGLNLGDLVGPQNPTGGQQYGPGQMAQYGPGQTGQFDSIIESVIERQIAKNTMPSKTQLGPAIRPMGWVINVKIKIAKIPASPINERSETGAVRPATVRLKFSGMRKGRGAYGSVKRNVMSATNTSVYESAAPNA